MYKEERNLRADPYHESMSEQSMVEIHPHVLIDALTQATSEKIFVQDQSPFEILPRSKTKAPIQRSRGVLGHIDFDRPRGVGIQPLSNRLLYGSIKSDPLPFTSAACSKDRKRQRKKWRRSLWKRGLASLV
ncbi:hypothetical protein ACOSQ3_031813 [Xanthoceras sorbifolium]